MKLADRGILWKKITKMCQASLTSSSILEEDKARYSNAKPPIFQIWYRRAQCTNSRILKWLFRVLLRVSCAFYMTELSDATNIGAGLYLGHPYGITINPRAIIGRNCNLHKGVTIGQENRGVRKGVPVIGDYVWIGVNSTVVGNIRVGNDVLIAPNSFVNCDVPDHSVVFGNPCVIKPCCRATKEYINRAVLLDREPESMCTETSINRGEAGE